jgi:hypothetical protein
VEAAGSGNHRATTSRYDSRRALESIGMPILNIDDERFAEIVAGAVRQVMNERKQTLQSATEEFLQDAEKDQHTLLNGINELRDKFDDRARRAITDSDLQIETFKKSLDERKKKVEDALSIKLIGGFAGLLIVIIFVAGGIVADQTRRYKDETDRLTTASRDLKNQIDAATLLYQKAFATTGSDAAAQSQAALVLATKASTASDGNTKQITNTLARLNDVIADYQKRFPSYKPPKQP